MEQKGIPRYSELHAFIDVYATKGFYGHIVKVCEERLRQNSSDVYVRFWRAFATSMEGRYTEAIRELNSLENTQIALAVVAALIQTHKQCSTVDRDELARLKEALKSLSKNSEHESLIFAGRYFWHAGKIKNSRQCVERVLDKDGRNVEALALWGWINLTSGQPRYERKSIQFFDTAIKLCEGGIKDIVALMGRARANEKKQRFNQVLEDLGQVIVGYPDFTPGLTEKARILMIMGNWDEALASAHRVMKRIPYDIEALQLSALFLLARESKSLVATGRITSLHEAIKEFEPHNAQVFFEVSRLCARLANRKQSLLQLTMNMIESACQLAPLNSSCMTEKAYQLLLLGDYDQAFQVYNDAAQLEQGNISALQGGIRCKIYKGLYQEAEEELAFLSEVHSTGGSQSMEIYFLQALIAWSKDGDEEKSIALLDQAMEAHSQLVAETPPGFNYFVVYNPDFVLEIVKEYMKHIESEPVSASDPPSPLLNKVIDHLTKLITVVPGMIGAQLLLAQAYYLSSSFDEGERALATCFKLDPPCAPAHIIQAQIFLAKGNYNECNSSLDQARSLDFGVRDTAPYKIMKSRLLQATGKSDEALKLLESAMNLPGIRRIRQPNPIPIHDRISVFLELAKLHATLSQIPEATKVMQDAKIEFKGCKEYLAIIIADAGLATKRRDFETALELLRSVPSDSAYAIRAKMKMADIYLKYKKNRKLYAACYQELAYQGQNVHSFILLGEAYMRIQEPEKAIAAYEGALKLNPSDPSLSSQIGRALVTTHDYRRAVQYYETALKGDPKKIQLFHELAELYTSLKAYPRAARVLQEALTSHEETDDPIVLSHDVTSLCLLAEVYQGAEDLAAVENMYGRAYQLQTQLLRRISSPDARREAKHKTAQICYKLAQHHQSNSDSKKARHFYTEALKHNEHHKESLLALARVHLVADELDECQHQCMVLMRIDPSNNEASLMLADLMFKKNQHDMATFHFQQLLESNPTQWDALSKLIGLLRRNGRLSEQTGAPKFLKLAKASSPKAEFEPGYHYCQGLYHKYMNKPADALASFNLARKDGEWGKFALINMIEIYISPNNDDLWNATESKDQADHVRAAENLLKELHIFTGSSPKYIVLACYAKLASKESSKQQEALNALMKLIQSHSDFIPAYGGLATALMAHGQPAKARHFLKQIAKQKMGSQYHEELEKCWLMLADLYIQNGKWEIARKLCRDTLASNKSCAKAWELLGLIMERDTSYRDAADKYEKAWEFTNEASCTVGFKLAFNYLKAKRYVEAIDVCHKVLKVDPSYPKIRETILATARNALRP